MVQYETILVEQRGRVGWITLNRPEALNALNSQVATDVADAAEAFDTDDSVGVIVVTGSERAFAAGADIKQMESKSAQEMRDTQIFGGWDRFARITKPVIAAVSGYALGGGCELAMMCDIIIAADTAKFGQPEINLGVIPGMGGTQRLARAIGYYKAAELVLTGRMIDAEEAEHIGLVSRVVAADDLKAETEKMAETIASRSLPSVRAAKKALAAARETPLSEGLEVEQAEFTALFDTADQKEGMAAFREKRAPEFTHQ
ncbi:enoyl-CoA hydratase-related protein [Microbacterium sp. YY-01]|uniref:enoyl-CoA hydratase-related protein n=1 Tax=Microbacterium sp. YY-01 TaxID=3421634 RepID=UPI003D17B145